MFPFISVVRHYEGILASFVSTSSQCFLLLSVFIIIIFQHHWSFLNDDYAARLLFRVYFANISRFSPSHMRAFADSLAGLGLAFTELQVMKLANSFKLFPPMRSTFFDTLIKPDLPMQPELGQFAQVTHWNGDLNGWNLLGISRTLANPLLTHTQNQKSQPWFGWITCVLLSYAFCK